MTAACIEQRPLASDPNGSVLMPMMHVRIVRMRMH